MTSESSRFGFFRPPVVDVEERQAWRVFVHGGAVHELEVCRLGGMWISLACPHAHPTEPRMVAVAAALSEGWLVEEIRGPGELSLLEQLEAAIGGYRRAVRQRVVDALVNVRHRILLAKMPPEVVAAVDVAMVEELAKQ